MENLKKTPLYELYQRDGARVIDFGGWLLPVQFSSIKDEHFAVRNAAGLFDVSHMGEIEVHGQGTELFLQYLVTNDVTQLVVGQAQYSAMCYENGGTVDDIIIYKRDHDNFLLVVNATNTDKDYEWIVSHAPQDVTVTNRSHEIAQLALQGPEAERILQKLIDTDLSTIGFFHFKENVLVGQVKTLISRTGYTGEDGFELYCPWEDASELWETLLLHGKEEGLQPCGLGARDTLRFEAKLPLYGQELTKDITPIEAGIGFAVKIDKPSNFIGKDVLTEQKINKSARKLVGIEMVDRGIPRSHYDVFVDHEKIGEVTTGTQSPTFKKNLGLALLKRKYTDLGTEVFVDIRGKRLRAKVVKSPFYKRSK